MAAVQELPAHAGDNSTLRRLVPSSIESYLAGTQRQEHLKLLRCWKAMDG